MPPGGALSHEPRLEVLVGGVCELHVADGRVLRGELEPALNESGELFIHTATGAEHVPRAAVRLLRLSKPHRAQPTTPAAPSVTDGPVVADGRPLMLNLPTLDALTVLCTGTHSAAQGGLWLDVELPDGASESWHVPPRSLPLLRWVGRPAPPRPPAPRNLAELWAALDRPPTRHARHLGMALVDAGQISPKVLAQALQEQADRRERGEPHLLTGQLLVSLGALRAEQLAAALSDWMGVPVVDLRDFTPEPQALQRLPRALAERAQALPLAERDERLVVAMADPWQRSLLDELRFASGVRIQPVAAAPQALAAALLRAYGVALPAESAAPEPTGGPPSADGMAAHAPAPSPFSMAAPAARTDLRELTAELVAAGSGADDQERIASESDNTLVRMVNALITEAVRLRASDIHIETAPPPRPVRVRLRVDGELVPCLELPARLRFAVVARLKIMAELDISEHRKPQDGKIPFARFGGPKVELRVVTVPTHGGLEDVVLRLLSGLRPMPLEDIGLAAANLAVLRATIAKPYGLVLICGPTGCGKTTTLHSVMRELNTDQRKIWTAEDPVEIVQEGLRQVQVNPRIGWTFAAAMRTFLRADPDVVMIGEMRDEETARIAVEASLTGHLVLSTLHTNDAANAVTRLVDIGMEPYKIAASLRGVVAQRLMRKLCATCKEVAVEAIPERMQKYVPMGTPLYRAAGCPECAMTGFRGRYSIVEVLTVTPDVERLIGSGALADKIAEAARGAGMKSLFESGLSHVLKGESSLDELMRVVDVPFDGTGSPDAALAAQAEPAADGPQPRRSSGMSRVSFPVEPGVTSVREEVSFAPEARMDFTSEAFQLLDNIGKAPRVQHLKKKVLLVDDEDQLRRVMKDLLERDGYIVAEARDGVQALDQVDRFGPDVIVLDLNLPGLDGYGVLSHLRSRPATANVPVVVLTAKGDEDNEVRVFELGADDFLTKPFRARALSARLDVVLNRRRNSA